MEFESVEKNETNKLIQLVSFKLDTEEYGINILIVQEIIRVSELTVVPDSPDYIEGIVSIRGTIIPIVNLRNKLGMAKIKNNKNTRIIIVYINEKMIGFLVDEVTEVRRISSSVTSPPPEIITGVNSKLIKSIAKLERNLLFLIDIDKVLSVSEKQTVLELA